MENSLRDTRPPYLPPEKSVCMSRSSNRTRHGTTEWFEIGKGVRQGRILSPCLFNLYAEYIMQNSRLDEAEAGIKVARRNINSLRYADDTTLTAESKEELKSLLIKVKEQGGKAGLKLNIQKTKIMASSPVTSWQIDGEAMETARVYFLGGSKITADGDCSHEIKRHLLLGMGFPSGSEVKASACNAGDLGSILGSGRSPGEGNGNPLQYSCLENLMDGRAWWATVHGIAKSQT